MECNRDEAVRAKTIAENKMTDKDFAGAKKFTLKAQSLYPELDGISQMLITLNVYISSENKVNGEPDWYGVLDVNPSDDEDTIRKQYRKLALMLHPDKNKSVGADGAFKILSEAWGLLSDKAKRMAYNERRNSRGIHQKVKLTPQSGSSSASPGVNGAHKATSRPMGTRAGPGSVPSRNPPPPRPAAAPAPVVNEGATFWTVCRQCMMHFEYLRVYVNRTLLCSNCQKAFHAVEMPPPVNFPKSGGDQNGSSGTSRTKQGASKGKGGSERLKRRKGEGEGQSKMKRGVNGN